MADNKKKTNIADEEQQMHMELQKRLAPRCKSTNIALVAMFFAFIYIFSVLFWTIPDKTILEEENKTAKAFPVLTLEKMKNGTYAEEFADYMADQFPFRNTFIGIKAAFEQLLLKGENNDVFIGKDNYLISRYDTVDEERLSSNIKYLSLFEKEAENRGFEVYTAFAGRTMDIATSKMPKIYGSDASDRAWGALEEACKENSLEYINLKNLIKEKFENGEAVMYKTDHHWTTLGAYYGYNSVAEAMGLPTYGLDHYKVEIASEDFYGTTWRSAGVKWTPAERMEFFRWEGDSECTATLSSGSVIEGLYDRSYLDKMDKYSAILGENTARCDITKEGDRETVLVVKDSFAHSLAPMMAENCNIIMIDMRYFNDSLIELAEAKNVSKILFLYNMDTLVNESGFRKLGMGLNK